MATVHFLYRSVREKSFLEVRLQHTENTIKYLWSAKTKIEVSKTFWTKQRDVKSRDVTISNEQTRVKGLCSTIENLILDSFKTTTPEAITKEWLQTKIDLYYNPKKNDATAETIPINLIEYFDYYIKYKENYPSDVLIRKYRVLQKKLMRFQTHRNKAILIKDVNKRFKLEFSEYCESQQYSRITIQRDFAEVKTICIDARTKGIETSLELDKLSFPRLKATNIFLTFDEIKAIENIEKSKLTDSLENAKDWLIISCYCGQRVSDFMRFTADMIRIENGKSLIEFTQKKTNKIMTVPLHPKIIEILNKRSGAFPYAISDQKYNDYIKTVCEVAELTQIVNGSKKIETAPKSGIYRKVTKDYRKCDLVSSHVGRRSFASNFYGTIPTTYLIYVTGHSTEAMFLSYIGKSNKDLALEITNYF
ncbi:phage integrase SAM-like domain-containing protein [Flavobacterium sp. WC2409]|uniref:Phage integrase SAM-like domain-containing protein n=1 Tax=Flavobacterium sp. WC2409 TaxID=3234139 RepID=A0AB39W3T6_9FLAO